MATIDLRKIRSDHIGSLVRPAKLKEVFARFDRRKASAEELRCAQDEAIRSVIAAQEAHHLPVVTHSKAMDEDEMWRKFDPIVETAEHV